MRRQRAATGVLHLTEEAGLDRTVHQIQVEGIPRVDQLTYKLQCVLQLRARQKWLLVRALYSIVLNMVERSLRSWSNVKDLPF